MKKASLKSDLFTRTIFKKTFGFMLLSSAGAALADIVDSLVLGGRLGENGLAAISFVIPIFMFYNILGYGMATGGAIRYAKLLGAGKAKEAVAHFNEMACAALAMGVCVAGAGLCFLPQLLSMFGVAPDAGDIYQMTWRYAEILLLGAPLFFWNNLLLAFIRADDGVKTASAAFFASSAADIGLNVLFVFGLDMGVSGAVTATIIGKVVGIGLCLLHLFRPSTILRFGPFQWNPQRMIASFKTGLSTSTQNAWILAFFIVMNNLLMKLGGTSAVAVFDVTQNVSFLALAFFTATGETLRPMAATFAGERNKSALASTLRLSLVWGLIFGVSGIAGLWLFAAPLCRLFGLSAAITGQYGAFAVCCYLTGAVTGGICLICIDYFQAVNKERLAFSISFLRGFALLLPMAFLCGHLFGLRGIWVMFPITEGITLAVTLFFCLWQRKYASATQAIPTQTWILGTEDDSLVTILLEAEQFAERLGATPKQRILVVTMIEELCTAILQTGFSGGLGCIQITLLRLDAGDFELHIRDNAHSFNLFERETRRLTSVEDASEDELNSLSLLLIKKNTKSHFYRCYQGFNTLTLTIGE